MRHTVRRILTCMLPGSDDERAAENLNLGLGSAKKKARKDAQPRSLINRLTAGYIGSSGQSSTEQKLYATEDPENGNIGQVSEAASREGVAERVGQTRVGSSNNVDGGQDTVDVEEGRFGADYLTPPSNTKRQLETYEIHEGRAEQARADGNAAEPSRRLYKKRRVSQKAKPPIVTPKRSKTTVEHYRRTRGNTRTAAMERESAMNPPISNLAGPNGAVPNPEPPRKRGRGRPPKKVSVVSEDSNHSPDIAHNSRSRKRDVEQPANADNDGSDDEVHDSTAAENEINDILMNPSPVKPIPAVSPRARRLNPAEQLGGPHARPAKGIPKSISAERLKEPGNGALESDFGGFSDSVDEPEAQESTPANGPAPDALEDEADLGEELPKVLKDVIPIDSLEEMLRTAQRAGHKQDKTTKEWTLKRTEKVPHSVSGRRMLRRIKRLIKAFGALKTARADENENAANDAQVKASATIEALTEAEVGFAERLGNSSQSGPGADTPSTYDMLVDVYFFLVPNLVEALKLGAEAHQDVEFSETEALKDIFDLLDLLRKLAEGAVRQPQASQPKSNHYRISFPTRSILPAIRILHKKLQNEMRSQERAEKTAAWNSGGGEFVGKDGFPDRVSDY